MVRSSVAAFCERSISLLFALALVVGLMPAAAFAVEGDGSPDGQPVASADASGQALVADDEGEVSPKDPRTEDAAPEGDVTESVARPDVINEDVALSTVAQAETTKSFFLAQTLDSTRAVPMVSAKLPIDSGSGDDGASEGDGEDGAEAKDGVSSESTVVGSFQHEGMTFAIEADGESVALMAADYSKLPEETIERQVLSIPEAVTPDSIGSYSVTRIANGAFAGLSEEGANPDYAGCKALFEDEALLAEAGIDPEEVARYLSDEDAASAAQDGGDASASSDIQAKAGAFACEDELGSDPSVEEGESADPDGADDVRTIVSMDGDVATLDDGTTYEFKNPLAGKKGILALGISASVSKIEDDAFAGFETLQYLVVADGNSVYASYDGALYSADLATLRLIPEGRVGAVRIAPSATSIDPEALSHRASVDALVVDADSAASFLEEYRLGEDVEYYRYEDSFVRPERARSAFDRLIRLGDSQASSLIRTSEVDSLSRLQSAAIAGEIETSRAFTVTWGSSAGQSNPGCTYDGCRFGSGSDRVVTSFPDSSHTTRTLSRCSQGHWRLAPADQKVDRIYMNIKINGVAVDSIEEARAILEPGYAVTWNGNGATSGVPANSSKVTTVTILTPSRTGYAFNGWAASGTVSGGTKNSSGYYTGGTVTLGSNVTFTAQWTRNTYTISYTLSGGSISGNPTSYNVDTATFTLKNPTRTGYAFSGWSGTGLSGSANKSVTVAKGSTGNRSYTANWSPNTYAVSFNANGGSGGQSANVTATYDAAMPAISTTKPVRAGYTFAGWYDTSASSGGAQYYTASCASARTWNKTANTTLYARWTPTAHTIIYDDGGGTFTGKTTGYNVETADFTLPATGTRTGYAFARWDVTGASGIGITGNGTTNVTVKKGTYGNLTAKAKWTINTYHLSWSTSHGTHANRTSDFTVEDCPIAMMAATPDAGYTFQGWSGTGIAAGSKSFTITSSMLEGKDDGETFSYAASFSANPYTAHLHANDGTGEGGLGDTVEHAVTFDAAVPSASVPKRYGHAFSGYWTKNPDGTKGELYFDEDGNYVRDSVWKDASDVDLYACWTLMANLEVPVSAPGTVTLGIDRATVIGDDAAGAQAGPIMSGTLRSSIPQEVPVASIELEALKDADDTLSATRILGEGNPDKCAVEVTAGSSAKALLSLHDASGASMKWTPEAGSSLAIPAATPVAAGSAGDDVTTDALGNLARVGELPLTYAMKLLPGFDVLAMPTADVTSEPIARIVFTVDLTGLVNERF